MAETPEISADPNADRVHRVEIALSILLRAGVVVSSLLVLAGLIVIFLHHPEYLAAGAKAADVERAMAFPRSVGELFAGLASFQGRALIVLGIFTLIATPVLRVAATVVIFFHVRDRAFTIITLVVLMLLLTSFLLGKAGG